MVVVTVLEGWLCVTNVPRNAGKWVLKALPSLWGGAAGTYEHQVLGATIAIMIGRDSGFREIMEKAVGSLRSVSLSDVTWEEFEKNLPDPKCYEKSKPAAFKDIDFFVSHSWSDDPKAKWAALQGVRRRFVLEHEREPKIWFDKYCIDQNAIDESVRRLPIFVVASQKMLVLLGHSYATRCWCMLELFVFSCCQRVGLFTDDHLIVEPLAVSPQARSDRLHLFREFSEDYNHLAQGEAEKLQALSSNFDIHETDCYREVDKQSIFGIIETAGDGRMGFNDVVRRITAATQADS